MMTTTPRAHANLRAGRRTWREARGSELVEFAIALPLLLAIMAGIVDFGRMFQRYEVVTNAAREGARLATLPGYTEADVRARVHDYVREGINSSAPARTTVTRAAVTVTPAGGGAFQAVRVTVQYTDAYLILGPVMGLLGAGSGTFAGLSLTAHSTMRMETAGS